MLDVSNSKVVLSAGIPSSGDDCVPRLDPEDRLLVGGENSRVVRGVDFVRRAKADPGQS